MTDIPLQIAAFQEMDKKKLVAKWVELYHQPPPSRLRKELMVPLLAYRLQEREYGGLSHAARSKLKQLAKSIETEKQPARKGSAALKPGTRLLRSWGGELHEVNIEDGAFTYQGRQFTSLSQIACEITGSRWSGPLFFGTRKAKA